MIETEGDLILSVIGVLGAFGIGAYLGQRRVCAVLDVIDAWRDQARISAEADEDGTLTDDEARRIAKATRRFIGRMDEARRVLFADVVCRRG